jgi:glycosyltransferase involved in cell wall biosynthesis
VVESIKRQKGLIFISNVTKAMEHEWFAEQIDHKRFDLRFVLFNSKDSELQHHLRSRGFRCDNYDLPNKLVMLPYVVYFAFRLLMWRPHFVHCHLFHASLIGLTAAKIAGIKKRISTRHHSDLHHTYHPHAVKYDLLNNRFSTHIIAVSGIVKEILTQNEYAPEEKVTVIPHGLPLKVLSADVDPERLLEIRKKYELSSDRLVIGVISRFVEFKGIHYILPAFKKLLESYPDTLLVLANAGGNFEKQIQELLHEIPSENVRLVRFESDAPALFKCFDVFVHTPVNSTLEAFGQVYIEAMAYEVPIVCTKSGVACEVLEHKRNALICEYRDSQSIYENLLLLMRNPSLKKQIIESAKTDVNTFTFEKKLEKIAALYTDT